MGVQRLDKVLSSQLGISRKDIKIAVRKGLARIDGQVIYDSAFSVNPELAEIVFDGQALNYKKHIYLMINKPKGVLSASSDRTRKTVIDLVPDGLKKSGLFPVGRLDRDTTGLLVITDDGDFTHLLLSPKSKIYKTYIARLDGPVTDDMITLFEKGVVLADGTVCRSGFLKPLPDNCAEIKICEGRYHQIKRMFGAVGLGVNELQRTALGGLILPSDFPPGACRELKNEEKDLIFIYKL